MASHPKNRLTPQEYLALERKAEYKSEYFDGEVFATSGASRAHSLVVGNVVRTLGNQALGRDCNVYPSDLRVKIERTGKYVYPDVVITCGQEQFEDEELDTLLNPVLIVEVLSDSTEAYDRGKKFEHYQFIESLAEYVLIAQDHARVEQYAKQKDGTWAYSDSRSPADVVHLAAIGCEMVLEDVYAKVALDG